MTGTLLASGHCTDASVGNGEGRTGDRAGAVIAERNGIPFRFPNDTWHALPMMPVHIGVCHLYRMWHHR
jgi:hypothetical protein